MTHGPPLCPLNRWQLYVSSRPARPVSPVALRAESMGSAWLTPAICLVLPRHQSWSLPSYGFLPSRPG